MRHESLFSLKNPFSQRAVVFFHYNKVCVINNSIIVHFGDPIIKSKILQTGNFRKNIMEYTSFINRLGEVHFLNGHLIRFTDVGLTRINDSISSRINFLPVFVVGNIGKRIGKKLK